MIIQLLATIGAILIGAYLIPGVSVTVVSAIVLAVLLGVINLFFKPIIKVLTLPINILTFGLFSIVVNAAILLLLAKVIPQFGLSGFWVACVFSILISLISSFFVLIFGSKD